ncbi:MAG: DUF5615 family PIN-like protein [Chloroflexi bacterium]|nr:DUF5615 family PIN-like protein [Chloroflexota bacterium]
MRLLFDENLSPRVADYLESQFPDSEHVGAAGLRGKPDEQVWQYARERGLAIVSKDNDFRQISFLYGPPPKVIWLSVGNAGTATIARLLAARVKAVREFLALPEESLLVLDLLPEDA